MGSSIAYHLTKNDLGAGVLVIEKDPMVSCCSWKDDRFKSQIYIGVVTVVTNQPDNPKCFPSVVQDGTGV